MIGMPAVLTKNILCYWQKDVLITALKTMKTFQYFTFFYQIGNRGERPEIPDSRHRQTQVPGPQ